MFNKKSGKTNFPLNEFNFSPDMVSKFTAKNHPTTQDSHPIQYNRDSAESPDYIAKRKRDDQLTYLTLSQLNLELDNNMNEMIFLFGRRKNLVAAKKKKMMEQADEVIAGSKSMRDFGQFEYSNDQQFIKITSFCQNPRTAAKILGTIAKAIPQIKGPRCDQQQRSQQFWSRNRKLQNDIDGLLQKLKIVDKSLENQNVEVHELCKQLDCIEQTLKSFVGVKSSDHVQKVEPLFSSKKRNYDILNKKIKDREGSKDKKIEYTKRIMAILDELRDTREERLNEIAQFFGLDSWQQFDQINFRDQGDFTVGFEELLKIKQKDNSLEMTERDIYTGMEILQKDQEKLYNEILKKQSDQARAFHSLNNLITQRVKYNSILSVFCQQGGQSSIQNMNTKQFTQKFKDLKSLIKRFIDEDHLLRQGLHKTSETSKTFINLLQVTENEKERRYELLSLLQACLRKRNEYEQRREDMRNIQFEENRNEQQMTQLEEDLEAVLTDGDLDGYKKIGMAMGKCESERVRLHQMKQMLEKQMDSMDRQVLSMANRIQGEYGDILSDVLPSDYEWSLKTGQDVKKLRNHLKKMYKRLGILKNE